MGKQLNQNGSFAYKMATFLFVLVTVVHSRTIDEKKSINEESSLDYPNYTDGVKYDEYPVVVPKRAALLLDRVMVALQKAIEDESEDGGGNGGSSRSPASRLPDDSIEDNKISVIPSVEDTMGLQRRGHGMIGSQQKGRVYWRCYFNAVTCFKRK